MKEMYYYTSNTADKWKAHKVSKLQENEVK